MFSLGPEGRRWAVAMSLLLPGLWPGPAPGQTPPRAAGRVVELDYHFTLSGLSAFRAVATLRLDGDRYAIDAHFTKEGLVNALSSTFNGRNSAWGSTSAEGLRPEGAWSWIQFRANVRTWHVGYHGDGSHGEEHRPPFTPKANQALSPEHKRGAFDPMTAAVLGALIGSDPCDRVYPIFDSRRRFDVRLKRVGTETLKEGEINQVRGEALVCEAVMKRIAGYDETHMKPDAYEARPPRLWFATLDGFERPIPVRMEMATGFGTVLGKLRSHKVRAMTAEDRRPATQQ